MVFILVRPVFPGNIGSAARAMKNFGFEHLRLVEPPRNYFSSESRRMAVGAYDVLKNCSVFAAVDMALKDISVAIGTTSGRRRGVTPLPFTEIAPRCASFAANNRVALLFGDERNGLSAEVLKRCHYAVTIPTAPGCPTLNVAQAVAICAYELTRGLSMVTSGDTTFTVGDQDDQLFSQIDQLLDRVGFSRRYNRSLILSEMRQFYQRAHPTTRELELLEGALRRINAMLKQD